MLVRTFKHRTYCRRSTPSAEHGPSCQTWLLATLQVWDYLLGVTVNSLRFFTGVSKRDGTRVLAGNLERTHPFDFNFASFAAMNARMSSDIPNSLSHCSL